MEAGLPTYEELDEGMANLKKHGNKVDYIVTHSCGQRALAYPQIARVAGVKTLCPESHLLSKVEDTVQFRHRYFGHFHTDAQFGGRYTALYQDVVRLE